jgi:PmbA/TldA metallopeptidase domain 1
VRDSQPGQRDEAAAIDPEFTAYPLQAMADAARQHAHDLGARYSDFRAERVCGQQLGLSDGSLETLHDSDDLGIAVRVIVDRAWGFAAAADLTAEAAVRAAAKAVDVARVAAGRSTCSGTTSSSPASGSTGYPAAGWPASSGTSPTRPSPPTSGTPWKRSAARRPMCWAAPSTAERASPGVCAVRGGPCVEPAVLGVRRRPAAGPHGVDLVRNPGRANPDPALGAADGAAGHPDDRQPDHGGPGPRRLAAGAGPPDRAGPAAHQPVALLGRLAEAGSTQATLPRESGEAFPRAAMPPLRVEGFNMSSVSQAT